MTGTAAPRVGGLPAGAIDPDDITGWDAWSTAAAIRSRAVSCVAVMEACLDRIDRLNPLVNAIVSARQRETLLNEARAADAELAVGHLRGPLHGLPWAVKDLALTAGIVTSFGSPLFADFTPEEDGLAVARLRAAGAIFIGKTNVPEFGLGSQTYNPVHGVTGNAYDPALTCGGSSGGAAVAVALGMIPAADGSDMMGSLRNPAAFNNIYGLRPCFGRVPMAPAEDVFFAQLAVEGPMARSVRDLALLLSVQAGPHPGAPLAIRAPGDAVLPERNASLAGRRIAWVGDFGGYLATEPGVLALCESALEEFAALGCAVTPVDIRFDLARLWRAWLHLRHVWAGARHLEIWRDPARRDLLKPELQWEIEQGLAVTGYDIHAASVVRSQWHAYLQGVFASYDVIAAPAVQVFPFDKSVTWPREVGGRAMDTYHRWMESTSIWTMSGLPCMSVPAGFDPAGRPTGLQLIGPDHGEKLLLEFAAAHEAAVDRVCGRRPPLGGGRETPAPAA